MFQAINPATGETIRSASLISEAEIDNCLSESVQGAATMRDLSLAARQDLLLRLAEQVETNRAHLAVLATEEMGKPIRQAEAEIDKCAKACHFYARAPSSYMDDQPVATDRHTFRRFLPLGTILAVMPWNYPFWQVFRFIAPATLAGNAMLLKHASNVPGCAAAIQDLVDAAGFPRGAFQNLFVSSRQVADIINDARVKGVTLTGSGPAGSAVGSLAGGAIKPCVLELGANDAFIIMPSADLELAVKAAVLARTQNNGQSCIAGKRFVVHEAIYDDFKGRAIAAFEALKVGDPSMRDTDIGPLATERGRQEVLDQIESALCAGGELVTGGKPLDRRGFYLSPGMIENVPNRTDFAREEVFGPIANLIKCTDIADAVAIANDSPYGLGSTLFSQDPEEIEYACDQIEAGATFVNAIVASDPRLPFGGVKASGIGRELSVEGVRAFQNIKTISLPPQT